MRRLPSTVSASLVAALAMGLYVVGRAATTHGHVGRWVTASAALGLALGAVAGLFGKTWGVGLALVSSAAFFLAGALGMGPPFFFAVAAVGALPAVITVRRMARFDAGATMLFVGVACALGIAASLAWNAVAWDVIRYFEAR